MSRAIFFPPDYVNNVNGFRIYENLIGSPGIEITTEVYATDASGHNSVSLFKPVIGNQWAKVSLLNVDNNRDIFEVSGQGQFDFYGTDGTKAGTQEFLHVNLGPSGSAALVNSVNNHDILKLSQNGSVAIWGTDGTTAGTHQLFAVNLSASSHFSYLGQVSGSDVFELTSGNSHTFYETQGTLSGTHVTSTYP